MAQKIIVELRDDIDGSEAHETVSFAVRGIEYEIDLNGANAAILDKDFAHYISHARRVDARKSAAKTQGIDAKAVRAWATQRGVALGMRGRIPHQIIERYRAESFA